MKSMNQESNNYFTKFNEVQQSKDVIKRDNSTRYFAQKLRLSFFFSLHDDDIIVRISASTKNRLSLIALKGKHIWLYWKWQAKFPFTSNSNILCSVCISFNRSKKDLHLSPEGTVVDITYEAGSDLIQRSTYCNISLIKTLFSTELVYRSLQTTWSFFMRTCLARHYAAQEP